MKALLVVAWERKKAKTGVAGVNSSCFTGDATYFTKGMGACGLYEDEGRLKNVAALNVVDYGLPTWKGPNCGRCVRVYFDNGMERTFKITDRCPGCKTGDLDLSEEGFPEGLKVRGRVGVRWQYIGCAGIE